MCILIAVLPAAMGQTCGLPTGGLGGPPAALIGVWHASFIDPTFGPAAVELILMQDGRFLEQTSYQAGALVTVYGTYQFPLPGVLRLNIERGEPTESCGPLGCSPILYPAGETYNYTLVNNTTLTLEVANCNPAAGGVCVFNHQKVV